MRNRPKLFTLEPKALPVTNLLKIGQENAFLLQQFVAKQIVAIETDVLCPDCEEIGKQVKLRSLQSGNANKVHELFCPVCGFGTNE